MPWVTSSLSTQPSKNLGRRSVQVAVTLLCLCCHSTCFDCQYVPHYRSFVESFDGSEEEELNEDLSSDEGKYKPNFHDAKS